MTTYTPAAASARSGFSLDTLRYYERIGLLYDIRRTSGGQRVFTDDDLDWLGVLRCLRDTGMPIADMRRYAELARDGRTTYAERLRVLRDHAAQLDAHVAALLDQRQHLHDKIRWYESQQATGSDAHALSAVRTVTATANASTSANASTTGNGPAPGDGAATVNGPGDGAAAENAPTAGR